MTDLSMTIAPKSDQLNSDDLIGGPRTITVTRVSANPDSAEQPISIYFEGDGGKPFKPCKSMRRVMVAVWGSDGNAYPGRSMTLYRDAEVAFGGMKVGGIRISHMTGIDAPMTMALTATRASRKPYTVKPLTIAKPADDSAEARAVAARGTDAFRAWWSGRSKERNAHLAPILPELKQIASAADAADASADPFALTPDQIEARMAEVAAEFTGN
jgi:hypothetical protein